MSRGRLLILDDDAMVGQILLMGAQASGCEAQWFERPQPFFEAVASWQPTHVAIDLGMPELSGIEVLRRLGAEGCTAQVIISSGAGADDLDAAIHEAQALGLRTAGVLAKPFTLATLRGLLAMPSVTP